MRGLFTAFVLAGFVAGGLGCGSSEAGRKAAEKEAAEQEDQQKLKDLKLKVNQMKYRLHPVAEPKLTDDEADQLKKEMWSLVIQHNRILDNHPTWTIPRLTFEISDTPP